MTVTSRKIDRIVLARASIIVVASVNLEIISPVLLVEKKLSGKSNICFK